MPIYEYRCEQCTLEFKMLVMRRDEPVQCPQCRAEHLQRLISIHAVGGLPTLQKVRRIFYDRVYANRWPEPFFEGHGQETIENRQIRFMEQKTGGLVQYTGKALELAHHRIYITKKLLEVRQALLKEALEETGIPGQRGKRWLTSLLQNSGWMSGTPTLRPFSGLNELHGDSMERNSSSEMGRSGEADHRS